MAIAAHWLFYKLVRLFLSKSESEFKQVAYKKLRYPTLSGFILAALLIAYRTIHFEDNLRALVSHATLIVLIVAIAWTFINGVKIFRIVTMRKYDVTARDNRVARTKLTQFRVLERLVNALIIIAAISAILMTFPPIRAFGAILFSSAGIAGIIIGFAAQKSIATFLAGIQIAITQPIRIDDAVVVEGEWGWIEEITFTYVVIRVWDLRRLIVPINYFIEKPFQNWTRNSADILGTVFLYTDYTVRVDDIRSELSKILEGNEFWDGKVNVVQVTDTSEKTMTIRLLVSAADSPTAWNLRVYVREKMIKFLQENYPESLPQTRVSIQNKDTPRT